MRIAGRRDGYSSFWSWVITLCVLFMVVETAHAQCDPSNLKGVHANFNTSALTCQQSTFNREAWSLHNTLTNTLDIVFISPLQATSWAGLGFAGAPLMQDASAVLAIMTSSGTVSASDWYLKVEGEIFNHTGSQLRFSSNPVVQYEGSVAYVSFTLDLATTNVTPNYLLFAYGALYGSGQPQIHINREAVAANFAQGTLPKGYKISTDHLRKAHAAVNIVGWGILLPVGAIIARYCRLWDPTWFYLHVTFQVLGFILIVAGLILGTNLYGRLKGLSGISRHRALGIFVFVLACLQILAIVLRPKKDAKLRRYWNWYHSWVGRIALLLAAVNILVGIHVAHEKRSVTAGYAVIAALEITACLLLEFLYWIKRSKKPKVPHHAPAFGYGDDV
ncbi:hypothetical protein CY35_03G079400 [Sphagnum magellanicum]|nr:hypothetical protein CY35_03G079400 [Sphagnum magellanicum]